MHLIRVFIHFFVTVSLIASVTICQDVPFKINKLNLVWTKAQHSLGDSKLKDLKADLMKHELDEISLKKMKAHNQDKDGLFEAAVRKRLLSLMEKYKLNRYFDDIHSISGEKNSKTKGTKKDTTNPTFRDSKLDKLWKKAEKSGFTQDQLMILHEEFQNHQDKIDEHYEIMNTIEESSEKSIQSKDRSQNSIESDFQRDNKRKYVKDKTEEKPHEKKARLDSNIHQGLKEKYSDIKQGYEELHKKIRSKSIDPSQPFEEEPVNELWTAAIQSNFSREELDSFHEELEHYETRIKKLKHFQYQLERNSIGLKSSSSNYEDDEEAKHVKLKVKDLTKKVEKTRKTLEKRIASIRDEL